VQQGFESMGDVMTRLSDEGRLVMSRARLPFSEAKSCVDIECTFCPCGATRFVLRGRTLTVNDEESMILHLAEAKPAWLTLAANAAAGAGGSAGWRVPAYAPGQPSCFEVSHLGLYAADAALRAVGSAMLHAATRYERHRPVSDHAAAALVYPKHNATAGGGLDPKASQVKAVGSPRLSVLPCTLDRLEASHAAAGPGDGTHSRGSSARFKILDADSPKKRKHRCKSHASMTRIVKHGRATASSTAKPVSTKHRYVRKATSNWHRHR
jgi:hypothetical protein